MYSIEICISPVYIYMYIVTVRESDELSTDFSVHLKK